MSRHTETGDGEEYTEAEAEALADALEEALADHDSRYGDVDAFGTSLSIKGKIEWNGSVDLKDNGIRKLNLDRFQPQDMRQLKRATQNRRRAGRSLTDKGWHAQLRKLTGSERGQKASEAAGLSPSRGTLLRWLSEQQSPSKENRERIQAAYESMRQDVKVDKGVAGTFTRIVEKRQGVRIRVRDIQNMHFD
jgi:hypothetical protein